MDVDGSVEMRRPAGAGSVVDPDDGPAEGQSGAEAADGPAGEAPGRVAGGARRRADLFGPADQSDDPGVRPSGRRRRREAEAEAAAGNDPAPDGKAPARRRVDASTEGLGLADLLAGALAEYRGI